MFDFESEREEEPFVRFELTRRRSQLFMIRRALHVHVYLYMIYTCHAHSQLSWRGETITLTLCTVCAVLFARFMFLLTDSLNIMKIKV